jgi:hypothetical protein
MAVGQGFSKAVTSGSVFWYDTGDMINSFPGKFGTNVLDGVIRNYNGYSITNYSNGKLFQTNGYTETVNIPALGNRSVESIEIYNVYSGYGDDGNFNCCPNLFRYSLTGWNGTPLSGSTLYMYEIIYKCDSGYTNPNYMYHYETRADGTYNTEFGVFDTSRQISLGDGWYYAWGEFTTQSTTAQGYFGLWYYNYNIPDKVSIASISLQQGNSVLPPRQFVPANTTRTATQSLIDIVGNNTLDVSNVSFNSTGNITFDGTNDIIISPNNTTLDNQTFSLESIFYTDVLNQYGFLFEKGTVNTQYSHFFEGSYFVFRTVGLNSWDLTISPSTNAFVQSRFNHVVCTYESGTKKVYVNGVLAATATGLTGTVGTNNGGMSIGAYGGYSGGHSYWFNGQIPVTKIYNRSLTQGEVTQNYNHYKTRFNLP